MRDILKEKQEIADIIVDGSVITPERNKSIFKEFVKRLGSGEGQFFDVENVDE